MSIGRELFAAMAALAFTAAAQDNAASYTGPLLETPGGTPMAQMGLTTDSSPANDLSEFLYMAQSFTLLSDIWFAENDIAETYVCTEEQDACQVWTFEMSDGGYTLTQDQTGCYLDITGN